MNSLRRSRGILALCILSLAALRLAADVVETKDGSRLIGAIVKIDSGSLTIDTRYAGTLKVKQSEIMAITTDAPVAVRLESGTRIEGKVSGSGGALQIAAAEGMVSTTVNKVAASFRNENYRNPLTPDVNAAGLDFGLSNVMTFANASLVNRLTFVPSFTDTSN